MALNIQRGKENDITSQIYTFTISYLLSLQRLRSLFFIFQPTSCYSDNFLIELNDVHGKTTEFIDVVHQ